MKKIILIFGLAFMLSSCSSVPFLATSTPTQTPTPTITPSPTPPPTETPTPTPEVCSALDADYNDLTKWFREKTGILNFTYQGDIFGSRMYRGSNLSKGIATGILTDLNCGTGFVIVIADDPLFDANEQIKLLDEAINHFVSLEAYNWTITNLPENTYDPIKSNHFETPKGSINIRIDMTSNDIFNIVIVDSEYSRKR